MATFQSFNFIRAMSEDKELATKLKAKEKLLENELNVLKTKIRLQKELTTEYKVKEKLLENEILTKTKTVNDFKTKIGLQDEIQDTKSKTETAEIMNVKLLLLDKDPNKDKEFAFRIHRKNPLKKLKDLFSKRIRFPVAKLHFFHSESDTVSGPDGRKIEDEDTPDSLDMQDGDYIDVCNDR